MLSWIINLSFSKYSKIRKSIWRYFIPKHLIRYKYLFYSMEMDVVNKKARQAKTGVTQRHIFLVTGYGF